MTVDIHDVVRTDQAIGAMHANAEVFPPAVEYAFRYLQASACHSPACALCLLHIVPNSLPEACATCLLSSVSRPMVLLLCYLSLSEYAYMMEHAPHTGLKHALHTGLKL